MENEELNNKPLDEVEEEYGEENSSKVGRWIAGVAGLVLILVATYYAFAGDYGLRDMRVLLAAGGLGGVLLFLSIFRRKKQ